MARYVDKTQTEIIWWRSRQMKTTRYTKKSEISTPSLVNSYFLKTTARADIYPGLQLLFEKAIVAHMGP